MSCGEAEGRRVFALTEAGRNEAEKRHVGEVAASFPGESQSSELHTEAHQLRAAVKHVAGNASPEQTEQAVVIVRNARQALYRLLADE